jgi:hypothetical protein
MLNRNLGLLLVAFLASTAEAKGPVVRIEIRDGVHAPLVISDAAIVGQFSIWNGPSVRTYDAGGVENPPTHVLDVDDGRFIDWPAGVVRHMAWGCRDSRSRSTSRRRVTAYASTSLPMK